MQDIEAQFWELCDRASQHDEADYRKLVDGGADEAHLEAQASERAMVKIIELVEANPQHRATFVRCFSEIVLWKRPAPFLLVAFCMRRLRFPEIQELIRQDADTHVGTAYFADRMNYWSAINHAYLDDVWECAPCFDYYRHEVGGDKA